MLNLKKIVNIMMMICFAAGYNAGPHILISTEAGGRARTGQFCNTVLESLVATPRFET
jgi:hypothetical protein